MKRNLLATVSATLSAAHSTVAFLTSCGTCSLAEPPPVLTRLFGQGTYQKPDKMAQIFIVHIRRNAHECDFLLLQVRDSAARKYS